MGEVSTITPYLHLGEVGEVYELPSCPRPSDWSLARGWGRRKRSAVDKKEMKETKEEKEEKEGNEAKDGKEPEHTRRLLLSQTN